MYSRIPLPRHSPHRKGKNNIEARMADVVSLEYRANERGHIAIITINNEKKLNAMNQEHYYTLSKYMREIAERDDVYITVLTGKGRFFSA